MEYNQLLVIPVINLYRCAMVSQARGEKVLEQLASAGEISVINTLTGRKLVSPSQGEVLFRALLGN